MVNATTLVAFGKIIYNLDLTEVNEIDQVLEQILYNMFDIAPELRSCDDLTVTVRLYGGWDELVKNDVGNESILTKKAQDLSTHIMDKYPVVQTRPNYRMTVELARSQAIRPKKVIPFTFRKRANIRGIKFCKKEDYCCSEASVPLDFLRDLVKNKKCKYCGKEASSIVFRAEQKLVDTMIAMDMIYYSESIKDSILVLVSDDDDFLPVIYQTGFKNHKVFNVRHKSALCDEYKELCPNGCYISLELQRSVL